jgi:transcriptional regulator with XRE-family HTH domain
MSSGILPSVHRVTSTDPFGRSVRDLLDERGWSQRELARAAGVDPAYISRALRRGRREAVSPELAARVALALGLPDDYFPECRERQVIEAVRSDPALRDRLYRRLARAQRSGVATSE